MNRELSLEWVLLLFKVIAFQNDYYVFYETE